MPLPEFLPQIVTLAEAKAWLRYMPEETHEDAAIQLCLAAATEAALATADGLAWADEESLDELQFNPPARLKLAILAHVERAFHAQDVDAPEGNGRLLGPLRVLDI